MQSARGDRLVEVPDVIALQVEDAARVALCAGLEAKPLAPAGMVRHPALPHIAAARQKQGRHKYCAHLSVLLRHILRRFVPVPQPWTA
jgi:hypothetical protein